MGVVYVGVYVIEALKEELAWALGKWLWVISNIIFGLLVMLYSGY